MTAIAGTTNIVSNAVLCRDWSISMDIKLPQTLPSEKGSWSNVFGFVQEGTSPGDMGNRIPALFARNRDQFRAFLGFRSQLNDKWSYGYPQWDFSVYKDRWLSIKIEQHTKDGGWPWSVSMYIDGVEKASLATFNPMSFDDVTGNFCEYSDSNDCFNGWYKNLSYNFDSDKCDFPEDDDSDDVDAGADDGAGDEADGDSDDVGDDAGDADDDAGDDAVDDADDDAEDNGMSVTCMNGDLVYMTATVSVDKVQMDLSETDDWTLDSGNNVYTKSWAAADFESSEISVDGSDNLVLTKSVSAPCKDEEVDGIPVCIATGHSLDFQCKYPLGTRTVKNDLNVSGHDATVDAEGVGELKYTLSIADGDVQIGEQVEVTITPANPNLVYAHLNDCNVEYNSASVSILDYKDNSNPWTILLDQGCPGGDLKRITTTSIDTCMDECDKVAECNACTFVEDELWAGRKNQCYLQNHNCSTARSYDGSADVNGITAAYKSASTKNELSPVCEIGANVDTASGKTDLTFDWKAFKWATATKDAVEEQTISCKITLSKDDPDFDVGSCPN